MQKPVRRVFAEMACEQTMGWIALGAVTVVVDLELLNSFRINISRALCGTG